MTRAPMTRQQLKQYRRKKQEIEFLEKKIRLVVPEEYVSDVVVGSHMQPVGISGYGSNRVPAMSNRKAALIAECRDIEAYIESVEDSLIRLSLTIRYIEGQSWNDVAEAVGGSNTEDSVRMLCSRFLRSV